MAWCRRGILGDVFGRARQHPAAATHMRERSLIAMRAPKKRVLPLRANAHGTCVETLANFYLSGATSLGADACASYVRLAMGWCAYTCKHPWDLCGDAGEFLPQWGDLLGSRCLCLLRAPGHGSKFLCLGCWTPSILQGVQSSRLDLHGHMPAQSLLRAPGFNCLDGLGHDKNQIKNYVFRWPWPRRTSDKELFFW